MMTEKTNEIRNHIQAIHNTPTKTPEGQFIINANAANTIKNSVCDFDNIIKPYDNNIHENLIFIMDRLFIPTNVLGILTGDFTGQPRTKNVADMRQKVVKYP